MSNKFSMFHMNHISIFIIFFFSISILTKIFVTNFKTSESNILRISNLSSLEGFGNQSGANLTNYIHHPHSTKNSNMRRNAVNYDDDSDEYDDDSTTSDNDFNDISSDDTSDDNTDTSDVEHSLSKINQNNSYDKIDNDSDSDSSSDSDDEASFKEIKDKYRQKEKNEKKRNQPSIIDKYSKKTNHKITEIIGTSEERNKTKNDIKEITSIGLDNLKKKISHIINTQNE